MSKNAASYGVLADEGKVRVNAAIIEAFKIDSNGFGLDFMQRVNDLVKTGMKRTGPEGAFQRVLDGTRDQLAMDMSSVPAVAKNDLSHTTNLNAQRQFFRDVQGLENSSAIAKAFTTRESFEHSNDYKDGTHKYRYPTSQIASERSSAFIEGMRGKLRNAIAMNSAVTQLSESGVAPTESLAIAAVPAFQNSARGLA